MTIQQSELTAWHKQSRSKYDDTSISWDYENNTVEVFTNRRGVYEKCLKRSPNPLKNVCNDVERLYTLTYAFDAIRGPETIVKVMKTLSSEAVCDV